MRGAVFESVEQNAEIFVSIWYNGKQIGVVVEMFTHLAESIPHLAELGPRSFCQPLVLSRIDGI